MGSISSFDGSKDDMTSDSVLSTRVVAHSCGSNCTWLFHQSAMSQARVITDASPASHFKFMKIPYDVRRELYLLLMANRDIYITTVDLPGSKRFSKYDQAVRIAEETKLQGILRLSPGSSLPLVGLRAFSYLKDARVALAILRVSHQIYEEAHLLPYTYNTFHMDAIALEYFINGRAAYQLQSIRSLSLRFDTSLIRHEFRYYSYVMLEASCSLAGLRNLMIFTKLGIVKDDHNLTPWTKLLKIRGIRQRNLLADMTVDRRTPDMVISNLRLQLIGELSHQTLVEENQRFAMEEFRKLPGCLRKVLMKSLVRLKAGNVDVWLPV